jgi:hypothetical protein
MRSKMPGIPASARPGRPASGPDEQACFNPGIQLTNPHVLLFSRILNIKKSQARQMERRLERRYPPGRQFPLLATIDVEGEPRAAKVLDLSAHGAGLQVSGPAYCKGSYAKLHLMLEETWMEFPCLIAHVKTLPAGCRLGLTAKFEDFAAQKAYLQLLQPVALGSAIRPISNDEIRQDEPELHKAVFTGLPGTELNVWRQGDPMGELISFLWEMDDYVIRGETAVGVLQISSRKQMPRPASRAKTAAPRKLPGGVHDEVRLLFRWTMLNLPKEVPGDIRTFLQGFID